MEEFRQLHERLDALEALNRKNAEELVRRNFEERLDALEAQGRRNDLVCHHLEYASLRHDPLIEIMFFRIQLALDTIAHLEEVYDAIAEKIKRF
jgi:hypothetical protein